VGDSLAPGNVHLLFLLLLCPLELAKHHVLTGEWLPVRVHVQNNEDMMTRCVICQ
jgi:hypothetical protein